MSKIYKGYEAAEQIFGAVKNIFKPKGKVSPTIKKVDPFVPKNKSETLARDLRRARQQRKTSEVKLDNTVFRIEQEAKKLKEMKAKGGRVGLKFGSKKSNVQKINETFSIKNNKKVPNKFKGFSKLPEKVQQKIDAKLAKKV